MTIIDGVACSAGVLLGQVNITVTSLPLFILPAKFDLELGGNGGMGSGKVITDGRIKVKIKETIAVPNLSPPGFKALLSPGQVFLFAVIDAISRTFSTRAPSIP